MAKTFVIAGEAGLTATLTIERKSDGAFWTGQRREITNGNV